MIKRDGNQLKTSMLCKIAGVSKSGYYDWVQSHSKRQIREEQDRKDFELILKAYNYRGYSKGARSIYMRLYRNGTVMNIKKIRRLMKKYNLFCPIRKPNPYRMMLKAEHENRIAPNLLNRQFKAFGARKALLTDITYLYYGNGEKCYLSVIKDAYTNEILAHVGSKTLHESFVLETLKKLEDDHRDEMASDTMIHSDQGAHYTSIQFSAALKNYQFMQSMSRRANCWDNAPQESFFGHMKDEIDIRDCQTFEDVMTIIDNWINYYNTERYQWGLAKLTPAEFYRYSLTGEYPK